MQELSKKEKFLHYSAKTWFYRQPVLQFCPMEVRSMVDTQKLKKRDLYLNKIIAFQDTEPVKVLTGIRRCGKSSLLKLMV